MDSAPDPQLGSIAAVVSQGRAGSSMVMQMLAAGGVRCPFGDWPAYEDGRLYGPGADLTLLHTAHRRGVKLVDPCNLPRAAGHPFQQAIPR